MIIAQYIILAGGYIVGGAITSGVIGGVRDEMDGTCFVSYFGH